VRIYTDGSCLANRGIGGWAYVLERRISGEREYVAGSHPRTTSNRMELTAVIQGLEALDSPERVLIVTDSEYVYLGITERLPRWQGAGWRCARGPLANVDLWQNLARLIDTHEVKCRWVQGHSGHSENDLADELARHAAAQGEEQARQ
jgi:ribonuclease HI